MLWAAPFFRFPLDAEQLEAYRALGRRPQHARRAKPTANSLGASSSTTWQ